MEKNPHRQLFLLSDPEAKLIDPGKQRHERPLSDAHTLVGEAATILSIYEAYYPEEMYPAADGNSLTRRRYALENKQRIIGLAHGIIRVAEPEMSSALIELEIDDELATIFKQ